MTDTRQTTALVPVSLDALHQLLQALNGAPHYIREIQATRNLPGVKNPINVLIDDFNRWADEQEKASQNPAPECESYQRSVFKWVLTCFGEAVAHDTKERNHRFLEESLELVQSLGATKEEALMLVDYVYSRPEGDPPQEVGGVLVTLAALCTAAKIDMDQAGNVELMRVWTKVDQIRAKQANKPRDSPLPGQYPAATEKAHCACHSPQQCHKGSDGSTCFYPDQQPDHG